MYHNRAQSTIGGSQKSKVNYFIIFVLYSDLIDEFLYPYRSDASTWAAIVLTSKF